MAFNSEPPTIQTPQHPVAYLCMAHHAFEAVPERIFSAVPVQHLSALLCFLLTLLFLYLLIIADNNQLFPHVQNRQGEYIRLTSLVNNNHVETVVLLSKGEVDSKKIRVEFSLEDMDMSEFQDGAPYTQIKDYVLEHSGLKVSNLYISQIKRKCGIEVGKNYNLPKSEDSRQPQCPPEKEKAIREAMKYFGMI